jgi:diguanylate cyclase (GGDEF)-like protein
MRRVNFRNWMFTSAVPRWSLMAIVAILIGMSAFALWKTMAATNRVDHERTATALNAMVLNHVQRLEIVTAGHAYSDDMALALYADKPRAEVLRQGWIDDTLGDEYDLAFAFSHDRKQIVAVDAGEPSQTDHVAAYSSAIAGLAARITDQSDCVGGVLATPDGPRLLTVARVRPISDGLIAKDLRSRPAFIAFSKRLDADMLAHIGSSLGVASVGLLPGLPKQAEQLETAELGASVGTARLMLNWRPGLPGWQALTQSLPVIMSGLALALIAIGLLARVITGLLNASLRDTLSFLPNRRALELEISRCLRQKHPQSLAILDIDGFKRVNDSHGSKIGDAAIRHLATTIAGLAPADATVARMGGDEFAIHCRGELADSVLQEVLSGLQEILQQPQEISGISVRLSVSAGLVPVASMAADASEIVRQADMALSMAKQRCRGGVLAYTPDLDAQMLAQARLAERIEAGIENEQLDMHFQPLVDARSHAIVSAEALLRWSSDAGIDVGPEEVVLAAETHGLGARLGLAIIRQSCLAASAWPEMPIAVNVTPSQLLDPRFPAKVAGILDETGFPADRLELEVTENVAVQDGAIVGQQLAALHALGIRLALDDFGSGYASIGFLRQFQFDKLKIDKSLVSNASRNQRDRALLSACIATAHALGLKVVAEGIEHPAEAELLRIAGCDILQGYLFSRPVTAQQFIQKIELPDVGPGPVFPKARNLTT